MHPPLSLEAAAQPYRSAVAERGSYAEESLKWRLVDVFSGDDDDPPPPLVQFLTSGEVGEPLLGVLSVLPAVILDDQS